MSEEKVKTCGFENNYGESCNRPLYDDYHCIFHSYDIEGKKGVFNDVFWKEFERHKEQEERYNFDGFVFPGDISFNEKEFDKDVSFDGVQFSRDAGFGDARFSGNADFEGAEFSGRAEFMGAQFSGVAFFVYAEFSGDANFKDAQFSGKAYFGDTQFSGEAGFMDAQFSGVAGFEGAQFSGHADIQGVIFSREADFEGAQFSGTAYFTHAQFSGSVSFANSIFSGPQLLWLFPSLRNKGLKRLLRGRYKIKDFRFHLSEDIANEYPVIDRMTKDAWYLDDFKNNHPFIYKIWWLFADCGRSFLRWALWSFVFAIMFAFIYYSSYTDYMLNFQTIYVSEEFPLFSFIYYSIVTFTTLGFGDIVPRTGWLQFWVMLEVIMGYIMLGGLISILANKLARRS